MIYDLPAWVLRSVGMELLVWASANDVQIEFDECLDCDRLTVRHGMLYASSLPPCGTSKWTRISSERFLLFLRD